MRFQDMTFEQVLAALQPKFPVLNSANSRPTSPYDEDYNCIAWAAQDTDYWWWPDTMGLSYWPTGIPREESIDAFIRAYELQGYVKRCDATLESGTEKVSLFASSDRKPTHAARQLPDGWWASKLGKLIDIEHEFGALDGPAYGTVVMILARPAK